MCVYMYVRKTRTHILYAYIVNTTAHELADIFSFVLEVGKVIAVGGIPGVFERYMKSLEQTYYSKQCRSC